MAFTFDNLISIPETSILCFRPLEPQLEADLYMIWKKSHLLTKPAKAFLESVRTCTFR